MTKRLTARLRNWNHAFKNTVGMNLNRICPAHLAHLQKMPLVMTTPINFLGVTITHNWLSKCAKT